MGHATKARLSMRRDERASRSGRGRVGAEAGAGSALRGVRARRNSSRAEAAGVSARGFRPLPRPAPCADPHHRSGRSFAPPRPPRGARPPPPPRLLLEHCEAGFRRLDFQLSDKRRNGSGVAACRAARRAGRLASSGSRVHARVALLIGLPPSPRNPHFAFSRYVAEGKLSLGLPSA